MVLLAKSWHDTFNFPLAKKGRRRDLDYSAEMKASLLYVPTNKVKGQWCVLPRR